MRVRCFFHLVERFVRSIFSPICDSCGERLATHCAPCAQKIAPTFLPSSRARFCLDCDGYFEGSALCPNCGCRAWVRAEDLVRNRARRHRCQAQAVALEGRT